jgi:hypothetical protein
MFVSKHHYAVHLTRFDNSVYFLNPPGRKFDVKEAQFKGILIVDYRGFIPMLRKLPSKLRKKEQRNEFERIEKRIGKKLDVIWSFDNSVFFDFDALRPELLKISHMVDLNQDFQFSRAARSANLCLGVIPKIVQKQKKFNSNSFLIRHGVQDSPENIEYRKLPGNHDFKAVYTGNLDMRYIDCELLYEAGRRHQDVDFVFIGKNHNKNASLEKTRTLQLPNVHCMPAVPSSQIFEYTQAADILLIAYTNDYYKNHASPHKLLEYLSTGNCVVSSFSEDFYEYNHLFFMGKNRNVWLDKFQFVREHNDDCNSERLKKGRKNLARENHYDNQILRIDGLIKKYCIRNH